MIAGGPVLPHGLRLLGQPVVRVVRLMQPFDGVRYLPWVEDGGQGECGDQRLDRADGLARADGPHDLLLFGNRESRTGQHGLRGFHRRIVQLVLQFRAFGAVLDHPDTPIRGVAAVQRALATDRHPAIVRQFVVVAKATVGAGDRVDPLPAATGHVPVVTFTVPPGAHVPHGDHPVEHFRGCGGFDVTGRARGPLLVDDQQVRVERHRIPAGLHR